MTKVLPRLDMTKALARIEQDEKNVGKMYKWLKDRGRPAHSSAINYCAVSSMTCKVISDSKALNLLINHPELFEEVGIGTAIFQAI
jgi:hypothetical protein